MNSQTGCVTVCLTSERRDDFGRLFNNYWKKQTKYRGCRAEKEKAR